MGGVCGVTPMEVSTHGGVGGGRGRRLHLWWLTTPIHAPAPMLTHAHAHTRTRTHAHTRTLPKSEAPPAEEVFVGGVGGDAPVEVSLHTTHSHARTRTHKLTIAQTHDRRTHKVTIAIRTRAHSHTRINSRSHAERTIATHAHARPRTHTRCTPTQPNKTRTQTGARGTALYRAQGPGRAQDPPRVARRRRGDVYSRHRGADGDRGRCSLISESPRRFQRRTGGVVCDCLCDGTDRPPARPTAKLTLFTPRRIHPNSARPPRSGPWPRSRLSPPPSVAFRVRWPPGWHRQPSSWRCRWLGVRRRWL